MYIFWKRLLQPCLQVVHELTSLWCCLQQYTYRDRVTLEQFRRATTEMLNAFTKSSFRNAWPGCRDAACIRALCAAASATRRIPKPICVGLTMPVTFDITALHAALATRRRHVHPTAIGRTPPPFLFRAHNDAPQKTGFTASGTRPARQNVHKVSQSRQKSPTDLCLYLIRYFKCWGRRPSNPPAEPCRLKRSDAARMADSDNIIRLFGCVLGVVALAPENSWVFAARGGCFIFSSSTVR